jgi:hypothetical protein
VTISNLLPMTPLIGLPTTPTHLLQTGTPSSFALGGKSSEQPLPVDALLKPAEQ